MKNEVIILNENNIKDKIYVIRGKQVMLDSDLAKIYGYTTKAFNQQVKNNIEKFDEDFMFQLTKEETLELSRSKNLTLNKTSGRGSNIKYLPYAFTEQGIYMLMTVLKGELATRQSKALIRIFKGMKDYIIENTNVVTYDNILKLSLQTSENTNDIKKLKNDIRDIMDKLSVTDIAKEILILNGTQVESNLAYQQIYSLAKSSIFIIDDYINLKTLVLLKDTKHDVEITIFSDNVNNKLHKIEYEDFEIEYPSIKINFKVTNKMFHDRYIILDYNLKSERIFHCGASSKDSRNKITTITEIQDRNMFKNIITNIINNKELELK